MGLRVVAVEGNDVVCRVTEGGPVSDNKGLSLPGMNVSVPAMSEKDCADLEFALGLRVDIIALSFVRSPADIDLVHKIMDEKGARLPVIAKLEKPEAVDNLEAIVLAFDGIMVARGDLGRGAAARARAAGAEAGDPDRPGERQAGDRRHPDARLDDHQLAADPGRGQSDVANAVLDGADAVMLSGETSVGRYPIKSVRTMAQIVEAVEAGPTSVPPLNHVPRTQRGVLSFAARDIGERLSARALVAFSVSGDTVRRLARLHTRLPLLAFTPKPEVRSQLAMSWGVETFLVDYVTSTDAMVRQVDNAILSIERFKAGDLVVIVAGSPPGTSGSTNLIRVHRLGEDDHA